MPDTPPQLTVLYRHDCFVAIDKPSGLLSVPGRAPEHHDSVYSRARALFPDATGPLIMHRLDWETSGVLLLALEPEAHAHLGRQFERRTIAKTYIAVLAGIPDQPAGRISLPIKPDYANRPYQVVDHDLGRESITDYRVLDTANGYARVEFTPLTGRTHQLRVHAAKGLGLPILGDALYGERTSAPRLLLHAAAIEITEPVKASRTRIRIESPVPF